MINDLLKSEDRELIEKKFISQKYSIYMYNFLTPEVLTDVKSKLPS